MLPNLSSSVQDTGANTSGQVKIGGLTVGRGAGGGSNQTLILIGIAALVVLLLFKRRA